MKLAARKSARAASILLLSSTLAALSTAGCATTDAVRYGDVVAIPAAYNPVERPLSIGEIAAELRRGRDQEDLADEIRERGLLAPVTEADIDLLLQLGATDSLLDAVQYASANPPSSAMGSPPPAYPPAYPPVYVTPPPVIQDYGWYPYAPYVPFGGAFIYRDVPRFRAPAHRFQPPHDGRRGQPDRRDPRPVAPAPGWQAPRVSPPPGSDRRIPGGSIPDSGDGASNRQLRPPRQQVDPRIPQDMPMPRSPGPVDPRIPRQ